MTELELFHRCQVAGLPPDEAKKVVIRARRLGLVDDLYVDSMIADALLLRASRLVTDATIQLHRLRENYAAEIAREVSAAVRPQVAEMARLAADKAVASPARLVRQALFVGALIAATGSACFMAGTLTIGSRLDALEPAVSGGDGPTWAKLIQLNPELPRLFLGCEARDASTPSNDNGRGCQLPVYVERSDLPTPVIVQQLGALIWFLTQTLSLALCGLAYLLKNQIRLVWGKMRSMWGAYS